MRIAIFSDNFYPELSGISDSIIALAQELAQRGHSINFYVPSYGKKEYAKAGLPVKEIDLGEKIKVIRFSSFPYHTGTGQGRCVIPIGLRAITASKFHPDIIHTQLFFGVGLEALFAARVLARPIIGTNHTALKEFLKYSPIHTPWFANALLKYVNWYYERCDLVTAPSHSVFDEMVTLGFRNARSEVISNPIDTKTFHTIADKTGLRRKYGFNEHTIISAGRLSKDKNPDVLIKALPLIRKKIPDAMLVFAGRGDAQAGLETLAKQLDVGDAVKFLGFISTQSLVEAYNAASMFAIASTSDTQSLVMMQAMACGLPVVGVRARALPEYINKENGFVVEPNNPAALAEKAIAILEDEEKAKQLGEGGNRYVQQFSRPAIAGQWEEIYKRAIESYNKKNP